MAELSFKQITDKLNDEFTSGIRKLIFWYDASAEFAEDVDSLELQNAKVYHLRLDNQFQTKVFLERDDTTTNYLIYAPFAKPDIRENHLSDTIRYSKEFFADRASLLTIDLGIDDRYKPVIQKYIRFFGEKKRMQAFYDLELDTFNRSTIEVGIMAVLCKCKTPTFEEILRLILSSDEEENTYIKELDKYGLMESFWKHCEVLFGYVDAEPTIEKLLMTMFVTYVAKCIQADLPTAWKPYVSFKSGNVIAFLDNLMNNALYSERFDALSDMMYKSLNAAEHLVKLPTDALTECNLFAEVDTIILRWMTDRLLDENVNAQLNGMTIPQLCRERCKTHFGAGFRKEYTVMLNAYRLITPGLFTPGSTVKAIAKAYTEKHYKIDRWYRNFYINYDRLEDNTPYEKLRELVERIYTNEYLDKIISNFTGCFTDENGETGLNMQSHFYANRIQSAKERTVVIISDAMRYEVGMSLFDKLQADEKCTASISVMQSMLPSITSLGMAALLPHRNLKWTDGKVTADGMSTDGVKAREAILQQYKGTSRAVQFDDIRNMKREDLRDVFSGMDVVYVYHNQIDARGDKANTENEVFFACEEALEEIHALIRKITSSGNTYHFIVTSDHGFIYKRDKLSESDKIGGVPDASKRYAVTYKSIPSMGVGSVPFSKIIGGETPEVVAYPLGSDLFKAPGSGLNYVHGGCSPQEMLVPVIEVKTERYKKEVSNATIAMISLVNKITNLITSLDFMQSEPVSDVVKETTYRICFVDENGTKVSNEHIFNADKKDKEGQKRMFKLRFSFKNQKYDRHRKYYLIAIDDKTGLETLRHEVIMDIAFADDFGFGF